MLRGAAVLLVLMLMTGLSTGVAGLAVLGETFSPGTGESSACWRGLTQRIALAARRSAPSAPERARPALAIASADRAAGATQEAAHRAVDDRGIGAWRIPGAHRLDLPPPAFA